MAFVFRPAAAASCFAFVIFMGTGSIPISEAADRDDHSYLPPWMLDQSGDTRKVDAQWIHRMCRLHKERSRQ